MNTLETIAESQPIQWRVRLTLWIVERLNCSDAEKDTAIDMLVAGLSEARNEGIDDAAVVVERLLQASDGESARILAITAKALRSLSQKNRDDSE